MKRHRNLQVTENPSCNNYCRRDVDDSGRFVVTENKTLLKTGGF